MNSKNSKTNKPHKFQLDLKDKLNLKDPKKNTTLANLSIYYTCKNIKSEYNNNKLKMSARTWNDTFILPDGYYCISVIPDWRKCQFNTNYWVNIIKIRYWTEPKYRKYHKRYGFLSFARKFGDKYGEELMDTATKTVIDAAKTASKTVVQKTAEATGDLIGNKIADRITSVGKSKERTKKVEEIYIPPEKGQQIIDDLKLFWAENAKLLYKYGNSYNCKFVWLYFWR